MQFSVKACLMRRRQVRIHPCDTDSENTSLLVNHSNIFSLFPPDTFMVITFAGALQQGLAYCVHLNAEVFSCADSTRCSCGTLNTVEPLLTVVVARSCIVSTTVAIFCPRPGPRLNYDVKNGPKSSSRGVNK